MALKTDETDAFFHAFKADAKVDADRYEAVAFSDSAAMADELLALVLSGIKRATVSWPATTARIRRRYQRSATMSSWLTAATSHAASGARPRSP